MTLRFAGSDARAFSRVLRDLGGAAPDDLEVLVNPSLADVRAGFSRLYMRMSAARTAGRRVELIVYYSGHSDEEGLLLSGRKLSYNDLRQQIRDMPADVHIAILDSCASGAFTRTKGGKRMPAFMVNESHQVHGHAFLSSSSATEQAQESDRLGGSFFTHAFVGGLRGAADANRDGRVTLNEAYQFAFNETVSRTQNTKYGAQHPNYEMHLVGTGNLILTDLRSTSAAVVLAKELSGRVFVRDRGQQLVLELNKQGGAPVVLGLPPDTYHLTLSTGEQRTGTKVSVRQGERVTLAMADFSKNIDTESTVARGGPPGAQPDMSSYNTSAVHIDLFHLPKMEEKSRHFVALNLLVGGGSVLEGLEIGGLVNVRTERASGTQIAGIGNFTMGPARLQIAGITNWTMGRVDFGQVAGIMNSSGGADLFQLAGIANVAAGPTPGVQVAGITNLQRDGSAGMQVAGIFNWSAGAPRFGQISGIGSWAGTGIDGFQLSGIASFAGGDMRGLQIGGITNHVRGDMHGMQIAGIYNQASSVSGAQIGLLNIGGAVGGAQFGLVNIARKIDGLQLGLVNVATESSAGGAPDRPAQRGAGRAPLPRGVGGRRHPGPGRLQAGIEEPLHAARRRSEHRLPGRRSGAGRARDRPSPLRQHRPVALRGAPGGLRRGRRRGRHGRGARHGRHPARPRLRGVRRHLGQRRDVVGREVLREGHRPHDGRHRRREGRRLHHEDLARPVRRAVVLSRAWPARATSRPGRPGRAAPGPRAGSRASRPAAPGGRCGRPDPATARAATRRCCRPCTSASRRRRDRAGSG